MKTIMAASAAFFISACGSTVKVKGSTQHNVTGDVKTVNEVVLKIDVSGCSILPPESQAQCIQSTIQALGDLTKLIKELACKNLECDKEEK